MKSKSKRTYSCGDCGSSEVERMMLVWQDANTGEALEDEAMEAQLYDCYWCRNCEDHPHMLVEAYVMQLVDKTDHTISRADRFPHYVTIKWGEQYEGDKHTYRFETVAELNAFMMGCVEMEGWMGWEVTEDSRDDR